MDHKDKPNISTLEPVFVVVSLFGTFNVSSPVPLNCFTFRSLISGTCILIHHTAISFHFNSDCGLAAPPSIQMGITSENL